MVTVGDVCAAVHNFFVVPDGIHIDTFTVKNGSLILPFLADGQYFRIVGSIFNDGVYVYPAEGLTDETFRGGVWAMAPERAFLDIVSEISAYTETDAAKATPYQSESFGGYSYSFNARRDSDDPTAWQTVYRKRLNRWRKLP
jgi:hypothetical protein